MDDQSFGEGFRVTTNRCLHRITLEIDSYESARVAVNPAGALAFECTDITNLYGAVIPTRLAAQVLGSIIGFSEPPDPSHEGETDQKNEQVLMFSDELTLEMWLRQEFFPELDVFEGEDLDENNITQVVDDMVKQVMVDLLGNKAKDRVRRDWRA